MQSVSTGTARLSASLPKKTYLAEVWGDVVDIRQLAIAIVIGAVISVVVFLLASNLFASLASSKDLGRAYAMLGGLAGCVASGVVCAKLFPPKRIVVEEGTDKQWRSEVIDELVKETGSVGAMADLPPAVVAEMKELDLYDAFAAHDGQQIAEKEVSEMDHLVFDIAVALAMGLLGAVVFAAIGLVSGTDETTTLAPVKLLVVLLGVPPAGVFTFWLAAAISKHMTHAIPTALLGIPGDTMAVPLLQEATAMRNLGAPHIALRKMISGGIVAAFIAVPLAVLFALMLAPFGQSITSAAPWLFLVAALLIAYFSPGRWSSVAALVPFVLIILALQSFTGKYGVKLGVSYFLGIAIGPLIADLVSVLSPLERARMARDSARKFSLAPDVKGWGGYFPNPLKVLDRTQLRWTAGAAAVSSATFVFSPVAMTVILGEIVSSRIKHAYHRLTTTLSVRNGVTESTYIAEALIPLIAFGPRSANAPPRFIVDAAAGKIVNLHSMLSPWEFFGYGMLSIVLAAIVAYPFSMNYARVAAAFVSRRVSHEAIIATFVGLVLVIGLWEGQILGLLVIVTVGLVGGIFYRILGFNTGVQFMGYYAAILTVPTLLKTLGV